MSFIPSKHVNVDSTLFLGWYDVTTSHNVKSTLKKRYVRQSCNLQRSTTLKKRCVFQRWIEQLSTSIFTTFGNVETKLRIRPFEKKRLNLDSKKNIYFWASKIMLDSKSSSFLPILRRICKIIFAEPQKVLKTSNILNNKKYI